MGDGTADDLKGKAKEAGGDLTGDDGLKREGKVDQSHGHREGQRARRERQAQGRRQQGLRASVLIGTGAERRSRGRMMTLPGLLLGIGLGGFVDGILLHQILQWHHMLTSEGSYPAEHCCGTRDEHALGRPLSSRHLDRDDRGPVVAVAAHAPRRRLGRAATAGSHAGRLGHVQSRRRRHRPPHPGDPSRQGWRRPDRIGPHVPGTRRCLARRRFLVFRSGERPGDAERCEAIAPRLDVRSAAARDRRPRTGALRAGRG